MRTIKMFIASMVTGLIWLPFKLMAQDGGMFIENLENPDSTYLEQEFMADAIVRSSGTGNMVLIIIAVLIVLAALGLYIIKKRRNHTLSRQSGN
jgi:LPXTG-motif cell wall-anchored protein